MNYIKNKGQWNSKVLYQAGFAGGKVFLEKNGFTYLFYPQDGLSRLHPHDRNNGTQRQSYSESTTLNFHAVKMEFVASNDVAVEQNKIKPFYHNYFLGNNSSKWVSQVPLSEEVQYPNLYEGISLKVFSDGNNPRYDFLIAPGADASAIQLKFTGQEKLSVQNKQLVIGTSNGDITLQEPYAYQEVDGEQKKVACRYEIEKNRVRIKTTEEYNHNLPLVIDPTLVFATFTGSTADNWGMSASYDNAGNGYTAGICFGVGYPLTPGAFQQTFGGGTNPLNYPYPDTAGFDIVTSKFDPTGHNLLFSTYLGGANNEEPQSIIVDNGNNLLILGRTYSNNFPVTPGAYDVTHNGNADIIVTKFNATGTALIGSTYIGGSGDDGVNYSSVEWVLGSLKYNYADDGRGDLILDAANNVYVAACTQSTDFPATSGCYQASNKGQQDGCVFKFNANLTALHWSTYLGGSQNDAAYNLALDNTNNGVFVTGGTESPNFPTTAGAMHPSYMGNIDGFLTHISSTGNSLIQSTFIGTSGYDQSYFVQLDHQKNVYIYGQTSGAYPISSGVYSNPNSGQFVHAFTPTLSSTLFSTEFGTGKGTPDIVPSAFLVDNCQNVYISGWGGPLYGYNNATSSTNGMPLTANAFQPTTDGSDFYFMVFNPFATSLWYATFFGGTLHSQEHVDGGTSRFDKSGVIYQAICEGCGAYSDMPTTPGAWSATNQSPNCNNALVKFSFNLVQTVAALSINPASATGCAPFNVAFTNQSQNATQFNWHFGDGATSTAVNPTHTYTAQGTYTVTLSAKDTLTCNMLDTLVAVITVNGPPTLTVNNPTICVGQAAVLTVSGASTYTWSNHHTTASTVESPTITTVYTVTATSAATCTNAATSTVTVNSLPAITLASDTICRGQTALLSASGAVTYTWNSGQTTATLSVSPNVSSHYTVTGTDIHSCVNTATANIIVKPTPVISISSLPICMGGTATITASGANTYTWNTGSQASSFTASPTQSTSYTVVGTNTNNCVSNQTGTLTVYALPVVSVNSPTLCMWSVATLTAQGASSYVWSNGALSASTAVSPTTTTNYTVIGTDVHNCKDTAVTTVQVFLSPTLFVSNDTICKGNTATLTAVSNDNNYYWNTGDTSATIYPQPASTTVYTVSSHNNICTTYKTATVVVLQNHTHLNANLIGMCVGDSINLHTTTPFISYLWSTGQTTASIEASQIGTYVVQTIDAHGCKGKDSVKVVQDSKVAIPLYNDSICKKEKLQLSVTQGNYTYLWLPGNSLNNNSIYNPVASPQSTTVYTVWVTNGWCVNTNTVQIKVNPLPTISVNPTYTLLMQGEAVTLYAHATDSCLWWPNDWLSCNACNTNTAIANQDITYTVTTTNYLGCSNYAYATIKVDLESTFYLPNSFTPNGDGRNETFKPAYTNIYNYKITIFDRWGLQLYQSSNPDIGWDGTYKNQLCQEDVYVYKAEYQSVSDSRYHTLSGTVTIVR